MIFQTPNRWVLAAVGIAAGLWVYLFVGKMEWGPGGTGSVMAVETRAKELKRLADSVPAKQELLERVAADRAQREEGVLEGETAALAYAELWGILRRVNESRNPPIDFGGVEFGDHVERLGDEYGEIQITVPFACRMDQLLALLADLPRQRELIATREIQISAADSKQKTVSVRLTVSAVVSGRLAPSKAGRS